MARQPMRPKSFKCDDETWKAAIDAAAVRGENLPDQLRAFLKRYAKTAGTAKPTPADRAWTCHECDTRITDVQPETWQAIPCGHYVTHVQMVTMTYGPPSWPVALSMEPRTAKPDTEETQP
jgi:uncharacterized protein with PIN domain